MTTVSHLAIQKCSEFFRNLYTLRSWDDLTTHVVNSIPTLISTDICSYNDMSSRRRFAAYRAWPSNHPTIPDAAEILGRYTHQHPVVAYVERTKTLTTRKITDFMSQREFRTTDLYNEFYRPLQLPYNMGACIAMNRDSVLAIGLNRIKRDFADHDIAMLDLLRPHLIQAYGNAKTVSAMQEEMAAMHQAMQEMDRAILYVSPQGRILWATPRANQLLTSYGLQRKGGSDWLSSPLREWFKQQNAFLDFAKDLPAPMKPLQIDLDTRSLRIRLVRNGKHHLVFLEEYRSDFDANALVQLGLSARETEVLGWVAQGKSNPEIGIILGISPRTVQKHLERIYGHLGVENRHAAIAVALATIRRV